MTTILVTHDKEEALSMADRVALLIEGQIMQYDKPNKIYERPANKQVSDFFGKRNYISGTIKDGSLITKLGVFKTTFKDCKNITFVLRPEEINISNKSYFNINGIIESKVYLGDKIVYTIKTLNQEIYCCTYGSQNFDLKSEVFINLDFENAHFFK